MSVGTSIKRVRVAALILAGVGLALGSIPSTAWPQAIPMYAESEADALARNVRILAESPRDFNALVGAGKAALQLGDTQAAAGFFGRAEEVNPNNPLPKAGMGAALVATGDPNGALTYFARAQQLGASPAAFGCDRGLAYDLLGNQVAAQTDYRAALAGPDRDEARRRLALSLAISGEKALALETLQPLIVRRDAGANRVRALVLALGGDIARAKVAVDHTMPGASARMDPFFRRLPVLTAAQKAAAVHLGIFPDSGIAVASGPTREDRLASIEDLLRQPPQQQPTYTPQHSYSVPAVAPARPPRVRTASVAKREIEQSASRSSGLVETRRVAGDPDARKIWLQLASGGSANELPAKFESIRSRKPSLFSGLSGYIADQEAQARLLIGPFHSEEDARLFADALATVRIDSRRWVSRPGQVVRRLSSQ